MWQTGYALTELERLSDDNSQVLLGRLAKQHHINIIGGRSLVIDPLCSIVKQASKRAMTLLVAEIDIDERVVCGQIPVFSYRRPSLYY